MSACKRMDGKPKIAYQTEGEATAKVGPGENTYRCRRCDQWHVGHTSAYGRPQLLAKYARAKARQNRSRGSWA